MRYCFILFLLIWSPNGVADDPFLNFMFEKCNMEARQTYGFQGDLRHLPILQLQIEESLKTKDVSFFESYWANKAAANSLVIGKPERDGVAMYSVLSLAVRMGRFDVATKLLQAGADPNFKEWICGLGFDSTHTNVEKISLKEVSFVQSTPFVWVLAGSPYFKPTPDIIKLFVTHGANPSVPSGAKRVMSGKLLKRESVWYPLNQLISTLYVDESYKDDDIRSMLEMLLAAGANANQPDDNGVMPLQLAAQGCSSTIAGVLVEHGSNPRNKLVDEKDFQSILQKTCIDDGQRSVYLEKVMRFISVLESDLNSSGDKLANIKRVVIGSWRIVDVHCPFCAKKTFDYREEIKITNNGFFDGNGAFGTCDGKLNYQGLKEMTMQEVMQENTILSASEFAKFLKEERFYSGFLFCGEANFSWMIFSDTGYAILPWEGDITFILMRER